MGKHVFYHEGWRGTRIILTASLRLYVYHTEKNLRDAMKSYNSLLLFPQKFTDP